MTTNLFNNSDQTFKTQITEEQDSSVTVDASDFTDAIYRIYLSDCTTVLVEKTKAGGGIVVIADTDDAGNPINVFQTTLLKTDMTMDPGQFPHQFKVVNSAALELPPVFENNVTIAKVAD